MLLAGDFAAAAGFGFDDFAGAPEPEALAFCAACAIGFPFGDAGDFAGIAAVGWRGGVTDLTFAGLAGTAVGASFETSILFAASTGGAEPGCAIGGAVSCPLAFRFS